MVAPQHDELDAKLVAALDRLARAQRVFRQRLATSHGLTPLQADLLRVIARDPLASVRVTALARELDVTQPTVSDAIASLERKGLVSRRSAAARRSPVRPTVEGAALAQALAAAEHPMRRALGAIPAQRRGETLATLLQLIAALHHHGVVTVARTCTTCRFYLCAAQRCALLGIRLRAEDLRVDCPDHELAAS